jgi:preprotein translocase subunit SecF
MIEIFKDTHYDFLGKKWICIAISCLLLLAGVGSILYRALDRNPNTKPFNLGVDFSGGTIANVKFKQRPDPNQIREALVKQGIEGTQIIIQPVTDEIGQAPKNEVLVRLPNLVGVQQKEGESATAAKATDDADIGKKKILAALATFNPADTQLKTDLNALGKDDLKNEFVRIDPLGLLNSGAATTADQRYTEIANRIVEYREKQRGGLIADISEVKNLGGIDPQLGGVLDQNFYTGVAAVKSTDAVSPQVGADLRNRAVYVTLLACLGMLVYVAFRFKSWGYGIGAVIAVFHDVLVTLGIFSIMQWEISLTVIAALLTLIGFSMNDTIVIFDRVREMLRLRRREKLETLTNDAVNETLSRTIITNGTTFLTVFALVPFGGEVLRGFSWALFIGIVVGTYSTVYIASPVMLWWEEWRGRARVAPTTPAAVAAGGGGTVNLNNLQIGKPVASPDGVSAEPRPKRKKGKKASVR